MKEKIRVLFLAANPVDTSPLRLGQEAREIDEKIEVGSAREAFELIQHHALRIGDLQQVLLRRQPHIVHFSGHGGESHEIVLENNQGKSHPVPRETLAALFRILKDNVRIVVLNACFTKEQAEALKDIIDYTIGTNDTVGDQASVTFAAAFYRALAFGRSVKEAFELARLELELIRIPGSDKPELYVRDGVDATEPFLPTVKGKR
ncbi:MAG TPA: CHAT domain-containing protein [Pyrinomonadaceae bacterium]